MSKVVLNQVADLTQSTTAQTTINADLTTIQTAFDNTLSRDGTTPNQMGASLDMNSNQIFNLPVPSTQNSPARLIDVVSNPTIVVPGTGTSGHVVPFLDGNNTFSGTNTFNALSTFSTVSIPGVWTNTRNSQTVPYAVVSSDNGKTIAGSGGFIAIQFNAASGYPSNFVCLVVNEDANAAKNIVLTGSTTFLLWPGQSTFVYNDNNVWRNTPIPKWPVVNATTIYVDGTNGNDLNDGLAAGTGRAVATGLQAMIIIANFWDVRNTITIQYAAGTYTGAFTAFKYTGSSNLIIVQGDVTTPSNVVISLTTGGPGCMVFSNVPGVWQVQGFTLTTSGSGPSAGLYCLGGSVNVNYQNMNFGNIFAGAGAQIYAAFGANVNCAGNNTISGSAANHVTAQDQACIHIATGTQTITGTPTFFGNVGGGGFINAHGMGLIGLTGTLFTGAVGAGTMKYQIGELSLMDTGGTSGSLPGNVAGSPVQGTLGSDGSFVA